MGNLGPEKPGLSRPDLRRARLVSELAGCARGLGVRSRRGGLMGGRGRLHSRRGHQGELRSLWVGRGACARQARAGVGTP